MSYSLDDVLKFVESLYEVVLLEYESKTRGYQLHSKVWIKSLIAVQILKK